MNQNENIDEYIERIASLDRDALILSHMYKAEDCACTSTSWSASDDFSSWEGMIAIDELVNLQRKIKRLEEHSIFSFGIFMSLPSRRSPVQPSPCKKSAGHGFFNTMNFASRKIENRLTPFTGYSLKFEGSPCVITRLDD